MFTLRKSKNCLKALINMIIQLSKVINYKIAMQAVWTNKITVGINKFRLKLHNKNGANSSRHIEKVIPNAEKHPTVSSQKTRF